MSDGATSAPPIRVFARLPHSWCGSSVEGVLEVAAAAEELGFDGVSVQDHVLSGHAVAPWATATTATTAR